MSYSGRDFHEPPPGGDPLNALNSVAMYQFAGITYRQLDHWCRLGVFGTHNVGIGHGHHRRFDLEDLRLAVIGGRLARTRGSYVVATLTRVADVLRDDTDVSWDDPARWLTITPDLVLIGPVPQPIDGALILQVPTLADLTRTIDTYQTRGALDHVPTCTG